MLRFEKAKKVFRLGNEHWNIGPLSFQISSGESVAFLGKSGSGKSTLLHLASGLVLPDSGNVFFRDRSFRDFSERDFLEFRRKNIGFVFQEFFLLPDFSLLENVAMPLLSQGVSRKRALEKAEHSLSEVDLVFWKHHYPSELSGGQRQRGALARALVGDPDILCADEPTGNLDSETGSKIEDLLFDRMGQREKMTLLLVTHDPKFAKRCQRTYTLEHGFFDNNHQEEHRCSLKEALSIASCQEIF